MINIFKNTKISKITAVLILFCLSSFSFHSNAYGNLATEVNLPAGTRIELETVQTINSQTQIGESIDFKVRADVSVDGKVVIKAGSIAKGTVMSSSKPKGLGKEGKVEIQVKNVTAADGKIVPLSASSISREGEDKATISILLGLFVCFLFLFMKGKDGVIPAGTTTDAVVASNMKIAV
ncbi:MAG: hypothetical protein ACKOWQ_08205 [Aquirufa sp.]